MRFFPSRWLRHVRPRPWVRPAVLTLLLGSVTSVVHAEDPPSLDDLLNIPPASPSDQTQQPGDRDADPAPGSHPAPGSDSDAGEDPGSPPGLNLDQATRDALTQEKITDTFASAVADMGAVSDRLARQQDPGVGTQRLQQSILDRLDQVIAQAKAQQQQQGGGSSSRKPGSPRQPDNGGQQAAGQPKAGAKAGGTPAGRSQSPAGAGPAPGAVTRVTDDQQALEQTRRSWGNLPPRLRNELQEGLAEPFSPVYQDLTRRYYQKLAEQE